ncbi:MAG TPA: hypothetical protein VEU08_09480 [Vicinamibacterales bacterium]|nr:hypothetical protein [Vicinamibacterales bacterium]
MLRLLKLMACLAAAMLVTVTLTAQSKIDVTGKWLFNVETGAGGGTPTVTLKQDGEKLTGHYSSQTFGEVDVTGSVKADKIEFSFSADAQGTALKVTYSGTIESKDAMKGKVDLGGMAEGTFTAKRQ